MRRWERNGCAVHAELPFRFSVICIMGASGSGKTTLLNCISTIDSATAGHIYLEGEDLTT